MTLRSSWKAAGLGGGVIGELDQFMHASGDARILALCFALRCEMGVVRFVRPAYLGCAVFVIFGYLHLFNSLFAVSTPAKGCRISSR